jgi:hypothetical protein
MSTDLQALKNSVLFTLLPVEEVETLTAAGIPASLIRELHQANQETLETQALQRLKPFHQSNLLAHMVLEEYLLEQLPRETKYGPGQLYHYFSSHKLSYQIQYRINETLGINSNSLGIGITSANPTSSTGTISNRITTVVASLINWLTTGDSYADEPEMIPKMASTWLTICSPDFTEKYAHKYTDWATKAR